MPFAVKCLARAEQGAAVVVQRPSERRGAAQTQGKQFFVHACPPLTFGTQRPLAELVVSNALIDLLAGGGHARAFVFAQIKHGLHRRAGKTVDIVQPFNF